MISFSLSVVLSNVLNLHFLVQWTIYIILYDFEALCSTLQSLQQQTKFDYFYLKNCRKINLIKLPRIFNLIAFIALLNKLEPFVILIYSGDYENEYVFSHGRVSWGQSSPIQKTSSLCLTTSSTNTAGSTGNAINNEFS